MVPCLPWGKPEVKLLLPEGTTCPNYNNWTTPWRQRQTRGTVAATGPFRAPLSVSDWLTQYIPHGAGRHERGDIEAYYIYRHSGIGPLKEGT